MYLVGDQWLTLGLRIRGARIPLSRRLQQRLVVLDNVRSFANSSLPGVKAKALKYCGQCQMSKPEKMPYFREGQSICRACRRQKR